MENQQIPIEPQPIGQSNSDSSSQVSTSQSIPTSSIPPWVVILLFIFFPLIALIIILSVKRYHLWLPYVLWIYSIIFAFVSLIFIVFIIPQFTLLYENLNVAHSTAEASIILVLLIGLALGQAIFAFLLHHHLHKGGSLTKVYLLIALVFLFVLPIVFSYQMLKTILPIYTLTAKLDDAKPTNTTHPSPSPIFGETANWKTYINTKAGFSFKYPSDHTAYASVDSQKPALIPATQNSDTVSIAAKEGMVFCCEPLTLSFSVKATIKKPREWADEYLKSIWEQESPAVKDTTFAGKPAVEANGRGGYGPPYRLIVTSLNGSLLVINQNGNDPLLNEVLATFKFTE